MTRTHLLVAALLAATALASCHLAQSGTSKPKISFDPVRLSGYQGAEEAVGKLVRFQGTAENARFGAAVVGDGLAVYCDGMDAWPEHLVGRKVVVSGLLERTDVFKATVGVDGKVGPGTLGGDYLLKHPKVE